MKYITTKDAATDEEIQFSYKDYGRGRPVVLVHGWPSSKDMWEYQIDDLVNAGLRVLNMIVVDLAKAQNYGMVMTTPL